MAVAVGETGTTSFTYEVTDGNLTDEATVIVTVAGANDAPVAAPDAFIAIEDGASVSVPVLTNDTDIDGDMLSIASVDDAGLTGAITVDGASVLYTPGSGFQTLGEGETATEVFTYTVTDPSGATDPGVVTATIQGTNDLPVFTSGTIGAAFEENNTAPVELYTAQATDVDANDSVTFTLVGAGSELTISDGGVVTFTGTADFETSPTVAFTVRATDMAGGFTDTLVTSQIINVDEGPELPFIGENGIFGTLGDDAVLGTNGDDALFGGRGDDILLGGKGADDFVISEGNDVIVDFFGNTAATTPVEFLFLEIGATRPADQIDLRALGLTFDDFAAGAVQQEDDVFWQIDVQNSLTVVGASLGDFSVDDFIF